MKAFLLNKNSELASKSKKSKLVNDQDRDQLVPDVDINRENNSGTLSISQQ